MKKFLSLLLVLGLCLSSLVGCMGSITGSQSAKQNLSLAESLKEFCTSKKFKDVFLEDNKSLYEVWIKYYNENEKEVSKSFDDKETKKKYGIEDMTIKDVTQSEDSFYNSLAKLLVGAFKDAIKSGQLKQSDLDKIKMLALFGINVPDIKISSNPTDEDVEKLVLAFIDIGKIFLSNADLLKTAGIDIQDLKKSFTNYLN